MKKFNLNQRWEDSPKAEKIRNSAKSLIQLLLQTQPKHVMDSHLRELLSVCLWKYSEASGKWNTQFCSVKALKHPELKPNHEHVHERSGLIDELFAMPKSIDEILNKCIGCIVLEDEHKLLTQIGRENSKLKGWDRYSAAGIQVVDRSKLN